MCFWNLGENGVDGKNGRDGSDGMNGKDGTNGVAGPAGKQKVLFSYSLLTFIRYLCCT